MDPLSAVSLAATTIQLLDFGVKLVSKSSEIYHSADGAETRNVELESTVHSLTALNKRIKDRARTINPSTEDELALQSLCDQCNKIGQELIDALTKAKVQGPHKRWKSVRQAVKEIIGSDGIQSAYERLTRYREQIVVVLLAITTSKQDAILDKVNSISQSIQESEERILAEGQQSRTQVLDAIRAAGYNSSNRRDVIVVSNMLSGMTNQLFHEQVKQKVLKSLYYPRMADRYERISEAHAKTFHWALEEASDDHSSVKWDDLRLWMREGKGIYWLTGKAGSGKSTLMKYIARDARATQYLTEWATPHPLATAAFYFWNSGTSMQKSQLGLWQCLLYDILEQQPHIISQVMPPRWYNDRSHGPVSFSWTTTDLLYIMDKLTRVDLNMRFCFFVDGLDEFDGDHENLINILVRLSQSTNIKILASSRPWLVFSDAFVDCPRLMLQDLTHDDILAFTQDSLSQNSRFSKLLQKEPQLAPLLIKEIVDKSSGVFLWVFLVVKSLIGGLMNGDRINDLQRRLTALPADLEQFFLHILTDLDTFYLHDASRFFRLALESPKPLSTLIFSFLDEEESDFAEQRDISPMSDEEESTRCENIERRLNSRCKGLLESCRRVANVEVSSPEGATDQVISYEVDFLHRTVRDFLCTPTAQVHLVAPDTTSWNANMALARAYVAQLKCMRCTPHLEVNFRSMWTAVLNVLHHLSNVIDDEVRVKEKVRLLDELDRAAKHYRDLGVTEPGCPADTHWVNTGYRFGFHHRWKCNLLTLAIQHDLRSYVDHQLRTLGTTKRDGKPLLGFALTAVGMGNIAIPVGGYFKPRKEIVELLFKHDADPNDEDNGSTVWVRLLQSLHMLAISAVRGHGATNDMGVWSAIVRLFLINGADVQVTVHTQPMKPILRQSLEARLGKKRGSKKENTYTVLEILRMTFGGNSSFDLLELEDLLDERAASASRNNHTTQEEHMSQVLAINFPKIDDHKFPPTYLIRSQDSFHRQPETTNLNFQGSAVAATSTPTSRSSYETSKELLAKDKKQSHHQPDTRKSRLLGLFKKVTLR